MRKNTRQAVAAFLALKHAQPAESIWTDGVTLWSYGTALAHRMDNGCMALNRTKYSVTTSQQQGGVAFLLGQAGSALIYVDDLDRGVNGQDLAEACRRRGKVWGK